MTTECNMDSGLDPAQEETFFPFFLIKDISHATAWINLEDIMLSEKIQSKKDKYCVIPLL